MLHRLRRQRAGAGLRLLRGGAGIAANIAKLAECRVSLTCPPSNSMNASRHVGRSAVVAGTRDNLERVNCHRHLRASGKSEKGKGGEHENLFHGPIPSSTILACPGLRRVGCDQNHGMLVSEEGIFAVQTPRFGLLRRSGDNIATATLSLRTLRMLLVFWGAHSLSSGVPFAHVRTIFSVSVIVSTSEMVDF